MHNIKKVGKSQPNINNTVTYFNAIVVSTERYLNIKSLLQYNQYIIYDTAQNKVKYLFKMKLHYRTYV